MLEKQYNIEQELDKLYKKANKENPSDDKTHLILQWYIESTNKCLLYNTIDYYYYIRCLFYNLSNSKDDKYKDIKYIINDTTLNHIIEQPFLYYKKYKNIIDSDISLKYITSLCSNPKLKTNPNIEDIKLTKYSNLFNKITDSNRKLLRCYDCGTNARGIFFNIIKAHRQTLKLSKEEKNRIKTLYNDFESPVLSKIHSCFEFLDKIDRPCVIIISLGLIESGHVFILEKLFVNNKLIVRQYQSALNSHMVLDYLYHIDIINNINVSLNYTQLFNDLKYLFSLKNWTDDDKRIFTKWFFYIFNHDININDETQEKFTFTFVPIITKINNTDSDLYLLKQLKLYYPLRT